MSRLLVKTFSISIDGYGAGPNQDLQNPLGVGGPELFGTVGGQAIAHRGDRPSRPQPVASGVLRIMGEPERPGVEKEFDPTLLKWLVKHGASPDITDRDGVSASVRASRKRHKRFLTART